MSNTQPRYYVLKPVSEKPEKDGWYDLIDTTHELRANSFYFKSGSWYITKDDPVPCGVSLYSHFLSKIESEDELVKEVERLRGLIENVFLGQVSRGHTIEDWYRFQAKHNL